MAMAYCLRCKGNREVANASYTTTANGMQIVKGVCPVCGRTIARLLGKATAKGAQG